MLEILMKQMSKKRKKKGFTLIELVIIVAIIAIIAVIAIPQFTNMTANARASTLESNQEILFSAVSQYVAVNQGLPTTMNQLDVYISGGTGGGATSIAGVPATVTNFTGQPANATYFIGTAGTTMYVVAVLTGLPSGFNDAERAGAIATGSTAQEAAATAAGVSYVPGNYLVVSEYAY